MIEKLNIRQLAEEIEQPLSIEQAINVPLADFENDLGKLVEYAEDDTQIVTAVRSPDTEEIRKLFLYAYHGKDVDW